MHASSLATGHGCRTKELELRCHRVENLHPAKTADAILSEEPMAAAPAKPKTQFLYKYRAFSPLSVQSLVADEVFFADPSSFNDPLDTKPCVEADLALAELQGILRTLIERREAADLRSAAKSIGYRGPNTATRIEDRSRRRAKAVLDDLAYHATNPEYSEAVEVIHMRLVARKIEDELLKRYSTGIYCLGTRASCPLMWSHYGDQHRGLCIGYTVPDNERSNLFKVHYGGSRLVRTSLVAEMLAGDSAATEAVNNAVLLRKAIDWKYEREWRLLGPRGNQRSPLELSSVTFGMRCSSTVQHAVAKALEGRDQDVKFYAMREQRGSFTLSRRRLDLDDLSRGYPFRSLTALEGFEDESEQTD